MAERPAVLVTCEHGGNRIPAAYRELFARAGRLLASHRGYDRGALGLARRLARRLRAPLLAAEVSRLLVDLNRSVDHADLFSPPVLRLPEEERRRILERHYLPHRRAVEGWVEARIAAGEVVLHLASHSFTPRRDGIVRNADLGLLYDPARPAERALCLQWQGRLRDRAPALRVRRNYPYQGAADGLTTALRRRFGLAYLGIELEVNQRHFATASRARSRLEGAVEATLAAVLAAPEF